MSTQTETHRFSNLPLTLTGNAVVTRLSGEVEWKIRETGARWEVERIYHIYIRCEGDALVEMIRDEALWPAVEEALQQEVRTVSQRRTRSENATEFSTGHTNVNNDLDNAKPEGAPLTSG